MSYSTMQKVGGTPTIRSTDTEAHQPALSSRQEAIIPLLNPGDAPEYNRLPGHTAIRFVGLISMSSTQQCYYADARRGPTSCLFLTHNFGRFTRTLISKKVLKQGWSIRQDT